MGSRRQNVQQLSSGLSHLEPTGVTPRILERTQSRSDCLLPECCGLPILVLTTRH